jgi:hypothetical protein
VVDGIIRSGLLRAAALGGRIKFFFWHLNFAILGFGLFFLINIWKPKDFEAVLVCGGVLIYLITGIIIRYLTVKQLLQSRAVQGR